MTRKFPTHRQAILGVALVLLPALAGLAADKKPRPVRALAFSPDGAVLAAAYGSVPSTGELVVWDLEKRRPRYVHAESSPVLTVAFSPKDDLLAIGTFRSKVKLLDATTGEVRRELAGHDAAVRCVAFSPDGKWLATASYDRTVKVWDVDSGEVKRVLSCGHSLRWAGFSPDGKWLAAVAPDDERIRLWSVDALDQPPRELKVQKGVVHAAFSPDSRTLASADTHGPLLLANLEDGGDVRRLDDMSLMHWVAFSPNGKWLAGAPPALGISMVPPGQRSSIGDKHREIDKLVQQLHDDDLSTREASSRRLAAFGAIATPQVNAALNSPDAEVRDRCHAFLEQVHGGDFSEGISGLAAIPECLAFSPDSKTLACGDWHGGIRLWRVGKWTELAKLTREDLGPPTKLVSEYTPALGSWLTVPTPPPFLLPQPSVTTMDAVETFRRALEGEKWDRAFARLEELAADSSAPLIPEQDGFRLPLRSSVFRSLAHMPPAGKNAYRLFYDAQARAQWDGLQNEQGSADLDALSKLATIDLMTSVGDLAADRLGDVLFEHGNLDGAIEAWQRIFELRPDTTLRPAELLSKTATAMARAGRWQEFGEVARQIERRHAGENVVVGGTKVSAVDYVARLAAARPAIENGAASDDLPELALPDTHVPCWQFRFENPQSFVVKPGSDLGLNGNAIANRAEMGPPAAVFAGDRLYVAAQGSDICVDLETGKSVWRILRPDPVRNAEGAAPTGPSGLMLGGDELWITIPPPLAPTRQALLGNPPSHPALILIRRDAKDGRPLQNSGLFKLRWNLLPVGSPLLASGNLYFVAHNPTQATDLHISAVRVADGKLLWSTPLGAYWVDPDRTWALPPIPTLLLHGARLFVDTQANGILEIQTDTGAIRWAHFYEPELAKPLPPSNDPTVLPAVLRPSSPLISGNMLYVKGTASSVLRAIRFDGETTLAWKRAAPLGSQPVAIDNERIYLAGDEVSAYDLQTQKLLWSTRLPASPSWVPPLVTQHRYYQYTARGLVELDKATGQIVRTFPGAEADSVGGTIIVTPKLLITISNRAITAYRLSGASADENRAAGAEPEH